MKVSSETEQQCTAVGNTVQLTENVYYEIAVKSTSQQSFSQFSVIVSLQFRDMDEMKNMIRLVWTNTLLYSNWNWKKDLSRNWHTVHAKHVSKSCFLLCISCSHNNSDVISDVKLTSRNNSRPRLQESRAAARKPRDGAAILFGLSLPTTFTTIGLLRYYASSVRWAY